MDRFIGCNGDNIVEDADAMARIEVADIVVSDDALGSNNPIPFFEFGADLVEKKERFDAWRETVRPIYDVNPLRDAVEGKESIKAWLLGNLIFTDAVFSRQSFHHNSFHIKNYGCNYLMLRMHKTGNSRALFGDDSFEAAPGEIQVIDFSREFHFVALTPVVAGVAVLIPHEAVGYDPGIHPGLMRFPVSSPSGRFLEEAYSALKDQLKDIRQDDAKTLADGFCGIVRALVVPKTSEDPVTRKFRKDRLSEIRSYVESHLTDPNLDADHICQKFNVSRSSLYRDFAQDGGVGQFIARRRLDRTFYRLLTASSSRGCVQEIAADCGYEDPGYFSRLFRRRFGISPSVVSSQRDREKILCHKASPRGFERDRGESLNVWLNAI